MLAPKHSGEKTRDRPRGRPRNTGPKASKSTIQSLDRALDVLDTLSELGGMTLSGLAGEMGQSASTLYRVLSTLENRQIVEMDHATQTWHIGAGTFRLGSSFLRRTGLVERARPVMRRLMEITGETANLGIERGGQVVFVSQVETIETIRAFFPPGTRSAMHSSGIGKALLAQFSERALARHLRHVVLERFTGQTICDPETLRAALAVIRDRGYAYDNQERTQGMRCVAASVMDQYGEAVAGISVSGPTNRMQSDSIERVGAVVKAAARELSLAIGGGVEGR